MKASRVEKQTPPYILSQIRYVTSLALNAAAAETLEQVLQQIADAARELIGARYAALGVPNQTGGLRYFKVSGISQADIAHIHHPPIGVGLLGSIMNAREPIRLDNMTADTAATGFPSGHPHMNSLLGVPIQIGDQLFGTFYLTDKENGEPFTEDDEWLLEMMASSAALAIAGAQVRDQQQNIARLAERERIAMELHDSVVQSLYALGLGLDFARRADHIPPEMIQETLQGLNQIIEDIRTYVLDLNQRNGNGHQTIRGYVEQAIADLYIPPDLEVNITVPDQPSMLEVATLDGVKGIVHECLSNVVRHAEASTVSLQVTEEQGYFRLLIADDGRGFAVEDLNTEEGHGLGLQNMQKRARLYGGTLVVESTPGQGTNITLTLPLIRL